MGWNIKYMEWVMKLVIEYMEWIITEYGVYGMKDGVYGML